MERTTDQIMTELKNAAANEIEKALAIITQQEEVIARNEAILRGLPADTNNTANGKPTVRIVKKTKKKKLDDRIVEAMRKSKLPMSVSQISEVVASHSTSKNPKKLATVYITGLVREGKLRRVSPATYQLAETKRA